MNVKRIILTSAIALGALTGYAQQAEAVVEYDFIPHFYIQGQIGGQETLGEGSFGDLLSPNAQVGVGYQVNPLFGARLSVNFWQSKGVMSEESKFPAGKWKWTYWSPMIDCTFNLTNAFGGYNPTRAWDLNLIGGIGANFASGNDEANKYNKAQNALIGNVLENIWDGSKTFLVGRIGLALDYQVTEALKVGVELQANVTDDKYNSKRWSNGDWYFNGLVGVKYAFGETYTKRVIPVPEPVVQVVKETVVVRDTIVQAPAVKQVAAAAPAPAAVESITRNVFYRINSSKINSQEMAKVAEIADYMKAHPTSTVHVTGYADKGTGTLSINLRLARERAAAVVTALTKTYGISESRITSSSMTDHEFQPFEDPVLNRVAICVVE